MEIKIKDVVKLRIPLDDKLDIVRNYRSEIGYMVEEIQDHLYHDRHRQAVDSIRDLRAVIRVGFFMNIVTAETYGPTMDYLYDLLVQAKNGGINNG